MIPDKLNNGQSVNAIPKKINEVIEYLRKNQIITDNKTITANHTNAGVILTAKGGKSSGGTSQGVQHPFRLKTLSGDLICTQGHIYTNNPVSYQGLKRDAYSITGGIPISGIPSGLYDVYTGLSISPTTITSGGSITTVSYQPDFYLMRHSDANKIAPCIRGNDNCLIGTVSKTDTGIQVISQAVNDDIIFDFAERQNYFQAEVKVDKGLSGGISSLSGWTPQALIYSLGLEHFNNTFLAPPTLSGVSIKHAMYIPSFSGNCTAYLHTFFRSTVGTQGGDYSPSDWDESNQAIDREIRFLADGDDYIFTSPQDFGKQLRVNIPLITLYRDNDNALRAIHWRGLDNINYPQNLVLAAGANISITPSMQYGVKRYTIASTGGGGGGGGGQPLSALIGERGVKVAKRQDKYVVSLSAGFIADGSVSPLLTGYLGQQGNFYLDLSDEAKGDYDGTMLYIANDGTGAVINKVYLSQYGVPMYCDDKVINQRYGLVCYNLITADSNSFKDIKSMFNGFQVGYIENASNNDLDVELQLRQNCIIADNTLIGRQAGITVNYFQGQFRLSVDLSGEGGIDVQGNVIYPADTLINGGRGIDVECLNHYFTVSVADTFLSDNIKNTDNYLTITQDSDYSVIISLNTATVVDSLISPQITQVYTDINALQGKVNSLSGNCENQFNQINAQIDIVYFGIQSLSGIIEQMQENITANTNDIGTLSGLLGNVDSVLDAVLS